MTVVNLETIVGNVFPFWCVVYSRTEDLLKETEDVVEVAALPHGNSKREGPFTRPYIRTDPSILKQIDQKFVNNPTASASDVFYEVLRESGGPMNSASPSCEPKDVKQARNRKAAIKSANAPPPAAGDLERLLLAQRNPDSPVKTVLVTGEHYFAFVYTEKMLDDIELFCCNEYDDQSCVLGIDTTFKLCDLWITDTCYRNKRLLSARSRDHPVYTGPIMLHFSKDDETFRRFCLELISAKPEISNLKKVGLDMEAAIFNGFKSVLPKLLQLYCAKHLQDRDVATIDRLHKNMKVSNDLKTQYQEEIVADIYGRRRGDTMENGLIEADNEDDFTAKLASCQLKWEKLCPGFYDWFLTHRKKDFITSVIKSARVGTNVSGIYYQNDIESKHAVEKRIQHFKGKKLPDALETIETLFEREESDEILALYGNGNYVLAPAYKSWFTPKWHSMSVDEKKKYYGRFCSSKPSLESTFPKPARAGKKANQRVRSRSDAAPTISIDRVTVTTPTFITSSQPVTSIASLGPTDLSISFQDPRVDPEPVFELFLKKNLMLV